MKFLRCLLFSTLLLISGCSTVTSDQNDLKWFGNQESAIKFGIKEEKISEQDILGEVKKDGEFLIVIKRNYLKVSALV